MKKDTVNNRLTAMQRDIERTMSHIAARMEQRDARYQEKANKIQERSDRAMELFEYFRLPWHRRLFTRKP